MYLVEFSFVLIVLLLFIFGVIELARAVFMMNTLQETTRRAAAAAAVVNPRNTAALDAVRQQAIFRHGPGTLVFGSPITDKYVYIDYLSTSMDSAGNLTRKPISRSNLPSCPAVNKKICMMDPYDGSCIRFVRVRICEPGSACKAVPYQPMLGRIKLSFTLPLATTIVPAESLGYELGSAPCN